MEDNQVHFLFLSNTGDPVLDQSLTAPRYEVRKIGSYASFKNSITLTADSARVQVSDTKFYDVPLNARITRQTRVLVLDVVLN